MLLCAGAAWLPRLLELSGIGCPGVLQAHSVEVLHVLPDTGRDRRIGPQLAGGSIVSPIISGNTGAAAIMIVEKAANMIREDARG